MSDRVRLYFDNHAQQFDAIYRPEKRLGQKLVDRLFHQVIHRRFQLTFDWCGPVAGKRVLDIGCGPGQYALEFARRGAGHPDDSAGLEAQGVVEPERALLQARDARVRVDANTARGRYARSRALYSPAPTTASVESPSDKKRITQER